MNGVSKQAVAKIVHCLRALKTILVAFHFLKLSESQFFKRLCLFVFLKLGWLAIEFFLVAELGDLSFIKRVLMKFFL